MINDEELIARDKQHIWHPCTQMKDFEAFPPLIVHHAKGSYLYTNQGPIIDAMSSWWCKSLGHGHPAVLDAIHSQLDCFEHVIGANTTHPKLVSLGEKLHQISGNQHAFFASDGSSAVEIAMKLAQHAMILRGETKRVEFLALENSYHGETIAALSVSDLPLYKKPYEHLTFPCHFLTHIPYVLTQEDEQWHNAEVNWQKALKQLDPLKDSLCAILVEPIVQGAGGMRCYSADFLYRLVSWAQSKGIYVISDEIMTGFGRTGKWLAGQHAGIRADLICFSKGITSGMLPLSCVSITNNLYDLFYDDYDKGRSFLHSHTYSANALAVSAALKTIEIIEAENIIEQASKLGYLMRNKLQEIESATGLLTHVRGVGAIAAADLVQSPLPRMGYRVYQEALRLGALIRPLGNTLYWLPPLNTNEKTIEQLAEITLNSIKKAYSI